MGLLSKAATARLAEPATVPVWEGDGGEMSFLGRANLWAASAVGALVATDSNSSSTWISGEGKIDTDQAAMNKQLTMLRLGVDRNAIVQLAAGTPALSSAGHAEDWEIHISPDGPSKARVALGSARTVDDKVQNQDLFRDLRLRTLSAMRCDPVFDLDPSGTAALPALDPQGPAVGVQGKLWPLADDYLAPLPAWFADGCTWDFPAGFGGRLLAAVVSSELPMVTPADRVAIVDLSSGGQVPAILELLDDAAGVKLRLRLGDTSSSLVRTSQLQRLLRVLWLLAHHVRDDDPILARTLSGAIDHTDVDPLHHGVESWVSTTPDEHLVGTLTRPPLGSPLVWGLVVDSDAPVADSLVLEATRSVPVRQRTWTSGLRATTRVANRRGHQRRVLVGGGGERPLRVRYGACQTESLVKHMTISKLPTWFWQLELASTELPDGRQRSALVCNGWARIGLVVPYAAELFDLLRATEWLAGARLPDAQVSLLTMRNTLA